jgi:hypothetical protein
MAFYICIVAGDLIIQRGEVGSPMKEFKPVTVCFCSNLRSGEVIIRFVNIDGIVDHHSLCFLLKKVRQHAGTANPYGAPDFTHGS